MAFDRIANGHQDKCNGHLEACYEKCTYYQNVKQNIYNPNKSILKTGYSSSIKMIE